jgi:alkanesulfonate monooxygenase SsuD/methylene tetrahydromethanopterin reductase-like flavin-dependent oxidoreductase (luciferase family)
LPPSGSCRFAVERGDDPDALEPRSLETFLAEQAIAGGPEQCIQQLQLLATSTGMSHVRCVFNGNGVVSPDATRGGMELFAAEVLPACPAIEPDESGVRPGDDEVNGSAIHDYV